MVVKLLPTGVTTALGADVLNAAKATTLYDLGCGQAKLVLQAFLEYPNLQRVVGVELSQPRYDRAVEKITQWVKKEASDHYTFERDTSPSPIGGTLYRLRTIKTTPQRVLELWQGDLFAVPAKYIATADILICEAGIHHHHHYPQTPSHNPRFDF